MKWKLGVLAFAGLICGSSVAQTPPAPDPLLCEGVTAILAKAGPAGWAQEETLQFDGGSAKCAPLPGFKFMRCTFASVKTCENKEPTQKAIADLRSVNRYFETRGAAAIATCLKDWTVKPYESSTSVSKTSGVEYGQPGKPVIQLLDDQSGSFDGNARCVTQSLQLTFEVK